VEANRITTTKKAMNPKLYYNNLVSFRKSNNGMFPGKGLASSMNRVAPMRADKQAHMMNYVGGKYT
jgi:hypothetical protein